MAKTSKVFKKNNSFSLLDGNKWISWTDGSKTNKDGSAKTNGYIPNTKANRDRITALVGKPERYGKRLIWW